MKSFRNLCAALLSLLLLSCHSQSSKSINATYQAEDSLTIDYWNTQHKGANQFNKYPSAEWFKAASEANIRLVRLTYDKWDSDNRDFLIGDADNYKGLIERDFLKLKESLDLAYSYGISVVLTPLSLPGARWKQNNNGKEDGRIWKDEKYLEQAKAFWTDLASHLNHHPAVVGFNLKNEPHPEIFYGYEDADDPAFLAWYDSIQGTPADINFYNSELTKAIRSVDQTTPIVIESGLWGNARTYNYLKPVDDPYVIYSFHMYEPYAFTTFRINNNKYAYPGTMPLSPWSEKIIQLDRRWLENYILPVKEWSEKYKIPANRIFAAEFGCSRKIVGVEEYLSDLISIFNNYGWHWAFYSYREDVWESMDYELGTEKPGQKYWEHTGKESFHENYNLIYDGRGDNRIWERLKNELSTKKEGSSNSAVLGKKLPGFPDTYRDFKSGKLEYGFFTPPQAEEGTKYPLVIFLHGWSQNMAVHLDWYDAAIQTKTPCFVYTPRTPVDWGDWSGWGDHLSEPMKLAVQVLDSLINTYPIDTCRLYIYGISMGGEGTFDLLDKFPGRFAAAMSVCGGGKPEWAANIARTPFWMFHGSDDDVNPVGLTRDVVDEMKKAGSGKFIYTEYKGYGHDIWNKAAQEEEWFDWFFQFSRCK